MKCKCRSCNSILELQKEQMRHNNQHKFRCPKCDHRIEIKPSNAKCGNCNKAFKYYDYKFTTNPGIVKCNNCDVLNKVHLKY